MQNNMSKQFLKQQVLMNDNHSQQRGNKETENQEEQRMETQNNLYDEFIDFDDLPG